ncbi:hypothetical protein AB3N62_11105 [Leptospira sp. WS4.C2]
MTENEFRDILFEQHKEDFESLIVGQKNPTKWKESTFPPLHILLRQIVEEKINETIESLQGFRLQAKELRLERDDMSTTRIDLLGSSDTSGLTIIELKKNNQTERQAFTELLAYSNHLCNIFPGLTESNTTSILIAPLESRTIKDAYMQEILFNKKNILALIPEIIENKIHLKVYYPADQYYKWFENNLFSDESMTTVALSFPYIEGFIDSDTNTPNRSVPGYSKSALNGISQYISKKFESLNINSMVYSSQVWGELSDLFPYPNTIYVVAINPFSSFRTSIDNEYIYGDSQDDRLHSVKRIYEQIENTDKEFWLENFNLSFQNYIIKIARKELDFCFTNTNAEKIKIEMSNPLWRGIKETMIESVFRHNLQIYSTGIIREIFHKYIQFIYYNRFDEIYYSDDLPKYAYKTFYSPYAVWEIIRGLGVGTEE